MQKKKMGKGRGHIIEGHHSLCWRRRFSLSRSFVVLAEDPKHPRCSTFWERVRVCVCVCVCVFHFITTLLHIQYDTAQNHHHREGRM